MTEYNDFNFPSSNDTPMSDVVQYLKSKLEGKISEYEDILKQKNDTIEKLNSQISSLEILVEELKSKYSQTETEIIEQNKELFVKMEESKNILLKQKEKHQKEIVLLKEIFDRTKIDISEMSKELDALKKEREDLKKQVFNINFEKTNIEDKLKNLSEQLSQSKKAVDETLSELFDERKKNSDLLKKIGDAEREKEELKKNLDSTKVAWDSERSQWKEMWEREKNMWESHRMEFAVWEERLRNEREAWMKQLKDEEGKGVEYARGLGKVLEDASAWSYKVGELLKLYANKEIVLPHVFVTEKAVEKKIKGTSRKVLAVAFIGLMMISSVFYMASDYRTKLHFSKVSSLTLDSSNYTGFVKKGDNFIFATWSDGIVIKDKDLKNISRITSFSGQSLKISAISDDGNHLWLLDMGGLRFVNIDENGNVLKTVKTLGVAPEGVASDGVYLWSFDAVTGLLYRYEINGELNGASSYSLDGIKNIDWLGWNGDMLYILSNNRLYRFEYKNDKFKKVSSQKAKNFMSSYIYGSNMYVLSDNGSVKDFEVLSVKNKERL